MRVLPNVKNWRPSRSAADSAADPGRQSVPDPVPESVVRTGSGVRVAVAPRPVGARRSLVSRRGTILVGIFVIAVILLALPAREYLRQRAEINSADEVTAAQQAKVDALQAKVDLWNNEDYVRGQARERLHFLLPGEVAYVVVKPGEENGIALQPTAGQPHPELPAGVWYSKLWSSVKQADQDPADRGGPFPSYQN
ncbi:MAG: septum formation initiator family protein [Actinomycetes bacterium]